MLILTRFNECFGCTPGVLRVGKSQESSVFQCYTLERPWLDNKTSISCIPKGTYKLAVTYSNKFKKDLIQILDVPNRAGIRIHPGNSIEDTTGCVLPCAELRIVPTQVVGTNSTPAYIMLESLIYSGKEDTLVIV